MEPQRGCKGLSIYRYSLMKRVMATLDLEVRERRDYLEQFRQPRHRYEPRQKWLVFSLLSQMVGDDRVRKKFLRWRI